LGKEKWQILKKKIVEEWGGLTEEQYKAFIECDMYIQFDHYIPYNATEIVIEMLQGVVDGIQDSIKNESIAESYYKDNIQEISDYLAIVHLLQKYAREKEKKADE
jgi:hypothetical protein